MYAHGDAFFFLFFFFFFFFFVVGFFFFFFCFVLFCFLRFDPLFCPAFSLSFTPLSFTFSCAFRMLGHLSRA